jgi:hypothetical protein
MLRKMAAETTNVQNPVDSNNTQEAQTQKSNSINRIIDRCDHSTAEHAGMRRS